MLADLISKREERDYEMISDKQELNWIVFYLGKKMKWTDKRKHRLHRQGQKRSITALTLNHPPPECRRSGQWEPEYYTAARIH